GLWRHPADRAERQRGQSGQEPPHRIQGGGALAPECVTRGLGHAARIYRTCASKCSKSGKPGFEGGWIAGSSRLSPAMTDVWLMRADLHSERATRKPILLER